MARSTQSQRPLRADAERNRERILEVAAELFRDRGADASLEEVAVRAGVGIGTVYRRFGDRDGLIDALFDARLEEVAALGERALGLDDPWDGLETFLRESARISVADRGFREVALNPSRGRDRAARARERIAPLAGRLLARAREDGRLRADFEVFDVPMLQLMLGTVADVAGEIAPELWERYFAILLDGLKASRDESSSLPVPALDGERYAQAMSRRAASRSGDPQRKTKASGA